MTRAGVYKRKRDSKRPGASWYFAYVGADGERHIEKGCADRAATCAMARRAETEADLRERGVIDVRDDRYLAHAATPLSGHVNAWRASMAHEGGTAKHADLSADRFRRLIAVVHGARPDDIDGKAMGRVERPIRHPIRRCECDVLA